MTTPMDLHDGLLELAGKLPDAELATARLDLAAGRLDRLPEPTMPDAAYWYAPEPADAAALGGPSMPVQDLTGRRDELDEVDRAAVEAVEALDDAIALWRTWRVPGGQAPTAGFARIYVLAADTDLAQATAAVMRALTEIGVADPQVETYWPGAEPPATTENARNSSALLWLTSTPAPPTLVPVFDGDGVFTVGHERLAGADWEHAGAYLANGTAVMSTTERLADVVEPERGEVVAMSYRNDGKVLWSDEVTYYTRTYGLAPDPALLAEIRAAGQLLPATDAADEHRAV